MLYFCRNMWVRLWSPSTVSPSDVDLSLWWAELTLFVCEGGTREKDLHIEKDSDWVFVLKVQVNCSRLCLMYFI